MSAEFKVIKVDPEGSGMEWSGHFGANIYNAKRCCLNCAVIFGSFVSGVCHDPNKPESADNDPRPVGLVYGELEPLNEEAQEILKEIEKDHPWIVEY